MTRLIHYFYSMARAILKRSKVLMMDEATASVDYGTQPDSRANDPGPDPKPIATDELISKTIRK
jgi:hypothetical protein